MKDLARAELDRIRSAGLLRTLRNVDSPQDAEIVLDGRRVINFSGNNTLGLANHPALRAAAVEALESYGVGAGASRSISGSMESHRRLERAAAAFLGCEGALFFSSGYQANVGVIPVLAEVAPAACDGPAPGPGSRGTVILSDELNHASLIDGIRLARAECCVYPHGDVDALSRLLDAVPPEKGVMVVTESLFSMNGDRAPLSAIAALKGQRPFLFYVDEAHAMGSVGPGGCGLAAEIGLAAEVGAAADHGVGGPVCADMVLGTLGKAFGVAGAFVAGSRAMTEILVNHCRSFIYTTAPPPAVAAAAERALELVAAGEGETLRARLRENVTRFRELAGAACAASGMALPGRDHIVPVRCPGNQRVNAACAALLEGGIYCLGIRHPTVPRGEELLRFSISALHDGEQLKRAAAALGALPGLRAEQQE